MIVYGNASRYERIDGAVETLLWMIEQALSADPRPAALRQLAVRAGELEQGLFDGPECLGSSCVSRSRALAGIRRAGSWIASAFEHSYDRSPDASHRALVHARGAIVPLTRAKGTARVTVPEGFAFYALFPESYRQAARRWAADHVDSWRRDVLVVGVRSIGTTLSAVVAQAIRAQRFAVRRRTVRPDGEPFERRLDEKLPKAAFGIVVDEGPGLSGSSMLAVADAMTRAGVGEVSLIHAHDRGPGPRATESAQRSWGSLRRYAAVDTELSFNGRTLAEELWLGVAPVMDGSLRRSDDVSAGAWRRFAYADGAGWPDVSRPLERPKLLCTSTEGSRVLFKFAGFAAAPHDEGSLATSVARRSAPLAARGFAPRLLGEAHGFVAWEWVDGRPLGIEDASPPFIARMGEYVARAAGPPLPPDDAQMAAERAKAMLVSNTRECLGEEAALLVAAEGAHLTARAASRAAGDGHLAPHEWVRERSGATYKTDIGGHDVDHTWTGAQSVLWDLAGALEEWDLHGSQEEALLHGYRQGGGGAFDARSLRAYRAAYAAHRVGQASFFLESESDAAERERLRRAADRWSAALSRSVSESMATPAIES
jgi:hypothetical protein